MIRTQIQLPEDESRRLREVAVRQHRSVADCIREGIGLFLTKAEARQQSFSDVAGQFRPQPPDDLKPHDQWWADSQRRTEPDAKPG
jgi:hypothetical protein